MEDHTHTHSTRFMDVFGLAFSLSALLVYSISLDVALADARRGLQARCDKLEQSVTELQSQVAALRSQTPGRVPAALDPVPALALHIARMEGYHVPGSLPRRQHNPGSLAYADQLGATRGARGYARFPTAAAGWAALDRDLRAKLARGYPLGRAWPYLPPKGK